MKFNRHEIATYDEICSIDIVGFNSNDSDQFNLSLILKDFDEIERISLLYIYIEIENDHEEIVYEAKMLLKKENFNIFTDINSGQHMIATVIIPSTQINIGHTCEGTVNVYASDEADFHGFFENDEEDDDDESVIYYEFFVNCLPIKRDKLALAKKNIEVILPKQPHTINIYSRSGTFVEQVIIRSMNTSNVYVPGFGHYVEITTIIEKTKGNKPEKTLLHWNLLNEENMIVGHGSIVTGIMPVGGRASIKTSTDKLEPGHTYRLEFI